MAVYVGLVTECVVMGQLHYGRFKVLSQNSLIEFYVVLILLAVLAFYQHRANIHRLLTGTERKTYISKEKNKAEAERYNNIVNKPKKRNRILDKMNYRGRKNNIHY